MINRYYLRDLWPSSMYATEGVFRLGIHVCNLANYGPNYGFLFVYFLLCFRD